VNDVAKLERPGHEEIRAIVNELYKLTTGWDQEMALEGVAIVGMFDAGLAAKMGKMFEAGREVRKYLEERGL
jgi:hypothetical protein